MAYCLPDEHTWVPVVGGKGYDPDYDTTVCIKCECYSSTRKHRANETHPSTMIGRRNLPTACTNCGLSLNACQAVREMERRTCCGVDCSHTS